MIDYLRISLTDRCNLRCSYCIPKGGVLLQQHADLLTFEEILNLVRIFSSLGIRIIRLTGGEPLVRKGIAGLITQLNKVEGIEEVSLTTNGTLLSSCAQDLKKSGIKNINISLDTLKGDKFKLMTGNDCLVPALEGIEAARELEFNSIKLNMVVMKGINDDEIQDFVRFAMENNLVLRFIEFMKISSSWDDKFFMPAEDIKEICQNMFNFQRINYRSSGPAEYYEYKGTRIGFIRTSRQNCQVCSRLRLTAMGELKACLYQSHGVSLRKLVRSGASNVKLKEAIAAAMVSKSGLNYASWDETEIYMHSIGG